MASTPAGIGAACSLGITVGGAGDRPGKTPTSLTQPARPKASIGTIASSPGLLNNWSTVAVFVSLRDEVVALRPSDAKHANHSPPIRTSGAKQAYHSPRKRPIHIRVVGGEGF